MRSRPTCPLQWPAGPRRRASRASAGQVFDGFAERGGAIVREVLVGAGEAGAEGRLANLEKAGARDCRQVCLFGRDERGDRTCRR